MKFKLIFFISCLVFATGNILSAQASSMVCTRLVPIETFDVPKQNLFSYVNSGSDLVVAKLCVIMTWSADGDASETSYALTDIPSIKVDYTNEITSTSKITLTPVSGAQYCGTVYWNQGEHHLTTEPFSIPVPREMSKNTPPRYLGLTLWYQRTGSSSVQLDPIYIGIPQIPETTATWDVPDIIKMETSIHKRLTGDSYPGPTAGTGSLTLNGRTVSFLGGDAVLAPDNTMAVRFLVNNASTGNSQIIQPNDTWAMELQGYKPGEWSTTLDAKLNCP